MPLPKSNIILNFIIDGYFKQNLAANSVAVLVLLPPSHKFALFILVKDCTFVVQYPDSPPVASLNAALNGSYYLLLLSVDLNKLYLLSYSNLGIHYLL